MNKILMISLISISLIGTTTAMPMPSTISFEDWKSKVNGRVENGKIKGNTYNAELMMKQFKYSKSTKLTDKQKAKCLEGEFNNNVVTLASCVTGFNWFPIRLK